MIDQVRAHVAEKLQDSDGVWIQQLLYESSFTISSFGQDVEGWIYLVDHDGAIYRLDPNP